MGFVKWRATTSARLPVAEFEVVKGEFLQRIVTALQTHSIPPALIINLGETGFPLVPVSNWTMEQEGTGKVKIAGEDDKREITVVVAVS